MSIRRVVSRSAARVRAVAGAVAERIEPSIVTFIAGLLLVGAGLYQLAPPAAYIVDGAILIWIALPPAAAAPPARRDA